MLAMRSYKRVLLYCAENQTAEKLIDGNFYYLVPEGQYVEDIMNRLRVRSGSGG